MDLTVSVQTPIQKYNGNGSATVFTFPFRVIKTSDLRVFINGTVQSTGYTLTGVNNPTGGSVTFNAAPAAGALITLQRLIALNRETDFQEAAAIPTDTLDNDFDRLTMMMQDTRASTLESVAGNVWDARGQRIINVANPTSAQDAVTKTWAETAMTSQLAQATTQAGISTTKASEAAASAAAALASQTTATAQAGIATTKANEASASAAAALASQNSASASATTATTQSGIATTQAGIATAKAAAAATSATNAAASEVASADIYQDILDTLGDGPVQTVNGQSGFVVLTKSDIGLANADNTSDANKPVSTATQAALNLKANTASPTFTGTVSGITKSMVGLGNVDNVRQVAQGTGIGQMTNAVKIGWSSIGRLKATVDATDLGNFVMDDGLTAAVNQRAALTGATFTGAIRAPAVIVGDGEAYLSQDSNNTYDVKAPGWHWTYERSTGNLRWVRNGGNNPTTTFTNSGDFIAGGVVYAGTGAYGMYMQSLPNEGILSMSAGAVLNYNSSNGNLSWVTGGLVRTTIGYSGALTTSSISTSTVSAGSIVSTSSIHAKFGSFGYVGLLAGGPSNTGHVEFVSSNGVRQGFIGNGTAQSSGQDLGDISYIAAAHVFGGQAYKPGGGSFVDSSDFRTKHNIVSYQYGLAEILALQVKQYSFKPETGRDSEVRYVGLIAQEAELVMPDLVEVRKHKLGELEFDDMRTLNSSNVTWALVNAVQQLHAEVATLREQVATNGTPTA